MDRGFESAAKTEPPDEAERPSQDGAECRDIGMDDGGEGQGLRDDNETRFVLDLACLERVVLVYACTVQLLP